MTVTQVIEGTGPLLSLQEELAGLLTMEEEHSCIFGEIAIFHGCLLAAAIRLAAVLAMCNPSRLLLSGQSSMEACSQFRKLLAVRFIHPYSDFLLHDVGTGDRIVQVGLQDTANRLRTVPLWGLRTKTRFMHDLNSLSLESAIERHKGEAFEVERRFDQLSPDDRAALITFLKSL